MKMKSKKMNFKLIRMNEGKQTNETKYRDNKQPLCNGINAFSWYQKKNCIYDTA